MGNGAVQILQALVSVQESRQELLHSSDPVGKKAVWNVQKEVHEVLVDFGDFLEEHEANSDQYTYAQTIANLDQKEPGSYESQSKLNLVLKSSHQLLESEFEGVEGVVEKLKSELVEGPNEVDFHSLGVEVCESDELTEEREFELSQVNVQRLSLPIDNFEVRNGLHELSLFQVLLDLVDSVNIFLALRHEYVVIRDLIGVHYKVGLREYKILEILGRMHEAALLVLQELSNFLKLLDVLQLVEENLVLVTGHSQNEEENDMEEEKEDLDAPIVVEFADEVLVGEFGVDELVHVSLVAIFDVDFLLFPSMSLLLNNVVNLLQS